MALYFFHPFESHSQNGVSCMTSNIETLAPLHVCSVSSNIDILDIFQSFVWFIDVLADVIKLATNPLRHSLL